MPVWKDDKIASDALNGKVYRPRSIFSQLLIPILFLVVAGLAAFAVFGKKLGLTTASRQVEQPAAAINKTDSAKAAAPDVAVDSRPMAKPEIITMPAVTLKEKIEKPAASDTKSSASAKANGAAFLPVKGERNFGEVYSALGACKYDKALELIHAASKPGADLKQANVLEARALLGAGKIADARAKFEPLAFESADTETGADALLGNFWTQAGTLERCRDSELDQVVNGADSWGAATAAFEQARRIEVSAANDAAKLERARALYQKALDSGKLESDLDDRCLKKLTELTNKMILDPKFPCTAPQSVFHKVEQGDSVEKIARKYHVNQGQIKLINHLNDKLIIRYGQTLKILEGDVLYKVDRTRLIGTLYINGVFIRRYPVGIGPGDATPVGTYTIERKVMNPDWWYDGKKVPFGDPQNILGTRWMGFAEADNNGKGAGLGVHGTAFPESVPGRESKGCVRMHNEDVEEIYDLMPQGGKCEISD